MGFIGVDKYDFICCMGKALSEMEKKVLLVDYTSLRGLMSTIPEYIEGKITEYQGLFYLGDPAIGEIQRLVQTNTYDFILMDFDYVCARKDIFLCQNIVFLTDMQRHHLEVIENIKVPSTMQKYLILRMEYLSRKSSVYLRQIAKNMGVDEGRYFYCPWGERERRNQLRCQYQYEIPWKKCPSIMKRIIWNLIKECTEPATKRNEMTIGMRTEQVG